MLELFDPVQANFLFLSKNLYYVGLKIFQGDKVNVDA